MAVNASCSAWVGLPPMSSASSIARSSALTAHWIADQPLTVLSPKSRQSKHADRYEIQVGWETASRTTASAILFCPRVLRTCRAQGRGSGPLVWYTLPVGTVSPSSRSCIRREQR